MDWVEEDSRAPSERGARDPWREPRGDLRPGKKGLEERLEGWVSRGRDLVDGVSGTRPGTRPPGRPGERPGPDGRSGLDGLGRWVEGRLDWLLDDRDDWREPWQEGEWFPPERSDIAPPPPAAPPRSSRAPLQAISRRGGAPQGMGPRASSNKMPPRSAVQGGEPPRANPPEVAPQPKERSADGNADAASQEWPRENTFSVPRWRREEPSVRRAANPLAEPVPPPPPGRPLPRSTRRR